MVVTSLSSQNENRISMESGFGNQISPSLAVLKDGGHVVVWSGLDASGNSRIYGERYAADGTVSISNFEISPLTNGIQDSTSIVGAADGGFIVLWRNKLIDSAFVSLVAQRFDVYGNSLGQPFTIANGNLRSAASATLLDNGNIIVAWDINTLNAPVQGRIIQPTGTPISGVLSFSSSAGYEHAFPSTTTLENGDFVVTWASASTASGWDVFARRYTSAGSQVGSDITVNVATTDWQHAPSVTGLSDGGFVVAWQSKLQDGSSYGIFIRKYNAGGVPQSGDVQVNTYTANDQSSSTVSAINDGSFIVTWRSYGEDGSDYGIYGRRMAANGTYIGTEFLISDITTGRQDNPTVAARADGGFVVAWDTETATSGKEIVTRIFSHGNESPDVSGQSVLLGPGESASVLSLFQYNNIQGNQYNGFNLQPLVSAQVMDLTAASSSGQVVIGGIAQPASQVINIENANMTSVRFRSGTASGNDVVLVRAFDGEHWSDWDVSVVSTVMATTSPQPMPEVVVNSYLISDQQDPSVAVLEGGGHVVVWTSDGQDGSGRGVFGQRYNANGEMEGVEFQVNPFGDGEQSQSTVVASPDGGFVVIWQEHDAASTAGSHNIYGLRYSPDGIAIGPRFTVDGGNFQQTPSAALLADGNIAVVWATGSTTARGRVISSSGTPVGDFFTYTRAGAITTAFPAVAATADGGFVVSWASAISSTGWDIFACRYNANGTQVGSGFQVNTTTTDYQHSPSVVGLSGGGFVVIWQSKLQDGSSYGVYARRYAANGSAQTGEFRINTYTAGDQSAISATATSDGGFLVTWRSDAQDGSSWGVYGQRYDAAGTRIGGEFRLNQTTAGAQTMPAIAARPDGGFVSAWTSEGQDGSGNAVVSRLFAGDTSSVFQRIMGDNGDDVFNGGSANEWISGLDGNDFLSGGDGEDLLHGGGGNDTLDGGSGADSLIGGTGNDFYYVDSITDTVIELEAEGTDEIRTNLISYDLGNNIENLTFIGNGSFAGTGNSLDNVIKGGNGSDTLDGSVGADTLIGGAGHDIYYVDNAGDVVIEYPDNGTDEVRTGLVVYTLPDNVEKLTYTGNSAFTGTGNSGANTITGGSGNDILSGLAGNDWLDGGTGSDTLIGGTGNDTYVVDSVNDVVTELAGQGTDTVRTSLNTYTLNDNVENLVYTGSNNFSGTGNAANNSLTGGSGADMLTGLGGNDTLNGGGGADTMIGGTGNDVYYVDNTGDSVVENSGEGTDTVRSSISYALGGNVENLVLTGSAAINGTGNDLSNTLTGNGAANVLNGGIGDDTLTGGGGNDALIGGDGFDTAVYSGRALDVSFTATVDGWTVHDLTHGMGTDTLTGIEQVQFDDRMIYLDGRNNAPLINQALTGDTDEDAGAFSKDLLIGASDFEEQALSIVNFIQTSGSVAMFTCNGGNFQLDPGQFGSLAQGDIETLTFSYDISDGQNITAQTFTLSIAGRNDLPTVEAQLNVSADEDTAPFAVNLLQGATDIDNGTTLSVSNFTQVGGTDAIFTLNGTEFQFDPSQFGMMAEGDTTTLTFAYDVFDGIATTAQSLIVTILGRDEPMQLTGTGGSDLLIGGAAADTLIGGAGSDTLTGGSGVDVFYFENPDVGQDVITDFQLGIDRLEVTANNFDQLPIGQLSADRFSSDGVITADTRFIFDPNTQVLLYDADGSGLGAAVGLVALNTSSFNYDSIFVVS